MGHWYASKMVNGCFMVCQVLSITHLVLLLTNLASLQELVDCVTG